MTTSDYHLELDGASISSTGDGNVSVMDAICAVTGLNCPQSIWEKLTSDHPEVLDYCEAHPFHKGKRRLVVDVEGWEKIFLLLPPYLSDGC